MGILKDGFWVLVCTTEWMGVGGQREQKVPNELRRHLETKKRGRQLHVISGSVYYSTVTYSQGRIRWTVIQKHSKLHSTQPRGHWDSFMVNLGYEGRCLETGHTFLSQDLLVGN